MYTLQEKVQIVAWHLVIIFDVKLDRCLKTGQFLAETQFNELYIIRPDPVLPKTKCLVWYFGI